MNLSFNVGKTYSTVGRMDACKSYIEVVIAAPKKSLTRTMFFVPGLK